MVIFMLFDPYRKKIKVLYKSLWQFTSGFNLVLTVIWFCGSGESIQRSKVPRNGSKDGMVIKFWFGLPQLMK